MKKISLILLLTLWILTFFFMTVIPAFAWDGRLRWDANRERDLGGYRVYNSTSSPVQINPDNMILDVPVGSDLDVDDDPTLVSVWVRDFPDDLTMQYFVITAYDTEDPPKESSPSVEFAYDGAIPPLEGPPAPPAGAGMVEIRVPLASGIVINITLPPGDMF